MNNGYYASIGNFMEQVNAQLRNKDDIIISIGTCSGFDRPYLYIVHCRQEDGTEYEINIKENRKYIKEEK